MMRGLFILLLMLSVIAASVFAAHIPPLWEGFTVSVAGMIVAIWGLRKSNREKRQQSGENENPLRAFEQLVSGTFDLVQRFLNIDQWQKQTIDTLEDQTEQLTTKMAQIHPALVETLGMKKFVSVILPFARAERLFNRALSAATDGYFDEARNSLRESLPFWQETQDLLNQIKKTDETLWQR